MGFRDWLRSIEIWTDEERGPFWNRRTKYTLAGKETELDFGPVGKLVTALVLGFARAMILLVQTTVSILAGAMHRSGLPPPHNPDWPQLPQDQGAAPQQGRRRRRRKKGRGG